MPCLKMATGSTARLQCDRWPVFEVLLYKFSFKWGHIIWQIFVLFLKHHFLCKNWCFGQLLEKIGILVISPFGHTGRLSHSTKSLFFKKRPTIRLNCFGKFTSWLTSLNEDAVGLMIKVFSNPVRDKKVLNFLQNEFLCIEDAFLLSPL